MGDYVRVAQMLPNALRESTSADAPHCWQVEMNTCENPGIRLTAPQWGHILSGYVELRFHLIKSLLQIGSRNGLHDRVAIVAADVAR